MLYEMILHIIQSVITERIINSKEFSVFSSCSIYYSFEFYDLFFSENLSIIFSYFHESPDFCNMCIYISMLYKYSTDFSYFCFNGLYLWLHASLYSFIFPVKYTSRFRLPKFKYFNNKSNFIIPLKSFIHTW